jgi:BirA family biotin operon repressor/biotin-[acetyl-CoA-carboxylase] ligase
MRPILASPHLGHPRLHLRRTRSTNDDARELAVAGAPHGTLVTTTEQSAGRGRQGRTWTAPAHSSLLMSLVVRRSSSQATVPLSLLAAVAVCDVAGPDARVKWPNDVVRPVAGAMRKLAGILVEARPGEGWAVLGIGINVAVRVGDLPDELRETAETLGLPPDAVESTLRDLLVALDRRLAEPAATVLDAWRARDAMYGRQIAWADGEGLAKGIDEEGCLLVELSDGKRATLDAGEVHLTPAPQRSPAS